MGHSSSKGLHVTVQTFEQVFSRTDSLINTTIPVPTRDFTSASEFIQTLFFTPGIGSFNLNSKPYIVTNIGNDKYVIKDILLQHTNYGFIDMHFNALLLGTIELKATGMKSVIIYDNLFDISDCYMSFPHVLPSKHAYFRKKRQCLTFFSIIKFANYLSQKIALLKWYFMMYRMR